MDFGLRDIMLLTTMSAAVMLMAFTFPALGMTEEGDGGIDPDGIPEFNMSADRFDFAGDFPNRPGGPSTVYLRHDEDNLNAHPSEKILDDGDWSVIITETGTPAGEGSIDNFEITIDLDNWSQSAVEDFVEFDETNEVGDTQVLSGSNWEIGVQLVDIRGSSESGDLWAEFELEVRDSPDESSDGILAGLPLVGGLFSAASSAANGVAWIGSVLLWAIGWMFTIVSNMLFAVVETVAFSFQFMYWITGTYTAVVSSASAWAAAFLLLPGLILMFEFLKITWLLIDIVWIG